VTRPRSAGEEDRLSILLRSIGALPLHIPLTETRSPDDAEPLRRAIGRLKSYDWLVVTSARAVPPILDACSAVGVEPRDALAAGLRICAVGPATSAALETAGLPVSLVPGQFIAEGIVEGLLAGGIQPGTRVLLVRAQEGRDVIPRSLEAFGVHVDVAPAYRTVEDPVAASELMEVLLTGELDVLTFTSGSGVRSFARAAGERGPLPPEIGCIVIGPATADVARELQVPVHAVAHPHTLEGLVTAVAEWAGRTSAVGDSQESQSKE
jgi:uroporphyrinogen III methyltransferase / synthase